MAVITCHAPVRLAVLPTALFKLLGENLQAANKQTNKQTIKQTNKQAASCYCRTRGRPFRSSECCRGDVAV
jgi:hypothetical protein